MRPSHPFLLLLVALSVACVPAGCSVYRKPTIVVGDAVVTAQTDEALRLDITLDLANPNDEALELRRFTYDVAVGGRTVYRGMRAAEAALSGNGAKRIILPAILTLDPSPGEGSPVPQEVEWSIRGSLLYLSPGEITEILLDTGVRKPRAGFGGSGRVRLPTGLAP